MPVLKTISPVLTSALITNVATGDGTVLYDGKVFVLSRKIDSEYLAKIVTSDYTITESASIDFMCGDFLCQSGGSLWTGTEVDGQIYEINPATLAKTSDTPIFNGDYSWQKQIKAGCTDDTYIYVGGYNDPSAPGLRIGKMKISDKSVTTAYLVLGDGNNYIHSLIDGDDGYLYGHTNGLTKAYALKIAKADFTFTSQLLDGGVYCDDIVQDANYFYLAEETTGGGRLARIAKADVASVTYEQVTTELLTGLDGMMQLADGSIVVGDNFIAAAGMSRLHKFSSIGNYQYSVNVSGILDATHHINELVYDTNSFHVLTDKRSYYEVRLYKFTVEDLAVRARFSRQPTPKVLSLM